MKDIWVFTFYSFKSPVGLKFFLIYFLIGGKLLYNIVLVSAVQQWESAMKKKWSEVAQSCRTLCNPMDCSLPGSSFHGIFQAKVLEWGAIACSRGSSQPSDWTRVSRIVGRSFTSWATREVWISRNDTRFPSLLSLPPTQPHPTHHRAPDWAPCII